MKKSVRIFALALALVTVVAVLASCGGTKLSGTYEGKADLFGIAGGSVTYKFSGSDVTITSTGTKIEYQDGDTWELLNSNTIENVKIPKVTIKLLKVNENQVPLSGAEFKLQKGENGAYSDVVDQKFTTGSDGMITFSDLTPGEYQLVETVAPAGYYKMSAVIPFTVDENGAVTWTETDSVAFNNDNLTFTVTNHAGSELPQTGGAGTIPYTIGGLLLMAASLLCGLNQRRRRERGCER